MIFTQMIVPTTVLPKVFLVKMGGDGVGLCLGGVLKVENLISNNLSYHLFYFAYCLNIY